MSDRASIIVRYEINDEELDTTYKGLICNHYRGFDPIGLVSRSAGGIRFMLTNARYLRTFGNGIGESNMSYQTIRRMFDVDFDARTLFVSTDAVSIAKRKFSEGEISKENLADEVLWSDTDYGQLLIDITGELGSEEIKYAFIDNIYNPKSYSVKDYMNKYGISIEDISRAANAFYFDGKTPGYMSEAEVRFFLSMDIYDYLYYGEMPVEGQRDILEQSELIESLDLSARSYNCLKRAGINTIAELKDMTEDQLSGIRNLSGRCIAEILEKIQGID